MKASIFEKYPLDPPQEYSPKIGFTTYPTGWPDPVATPIEDTDFGLLLLACLKVELWPETEIFPPHILAYNWRLQVTRQRDLSQLLLPLHDPEAPIRAVLWMVSRHFIEQDMCSLLGIDWEANSEISSQIVRASCGPRGPKSDSPIQTLEQATAAAYEKLDVWDAAVARARKRLTLRILPQARKFVTAMGTLLALTRELLDAAVAGDRERIASVEERMGRLPETAGGA